MATDITTLDYADVIARVVRIRDECDEILQILIPQGSEPAACRHPPEAIEDLSTMDEDGECYRCRKCGATQQFPFHSEE